MILLYVALISIERVNNEDPVQFTVPGQEFREPRVQIANKDYCGMITRRPSYDGFTIPFFRI